MVGTSEVAETSQAKKKRCAWSGEEGDAFSLSSSRSVFASVSRSVYITILEPGTG